MKSNEKVWEKRAKLPGCGTVCCGCQCQQSVTPFDRWIRALLASTELKADGHMTGGLALTQLKEGGCLGAYQHMLPYLFTLNIFPFFPPFFHLFQSSQRFSVFACDCKHKALRQTCVTIVFLFINISFYPSFFGGNWRVFPWDTIIHVWKASNSLWLTSHSDRNQPISSLPGTDQCWDHWTQNIWLSCSSEDVMSSNIAMCFKGLSELSPIWQQGPKTSGAHALLWVHGLVKNNGSLDRLCSRCCCYCFGLFVKPKHAPQNPHLFMCSALDRCLGNTKESMMLANESKRRSQNVLQVRNVRADMTDTKKDDRTALNVNFYSEYQIWWKYMASHIKRTS